MPLSRSKRPKPAIRLTGARDVSECGLVAGEGMANLFRVACVLRDHPGGRDDVWLVERLDPERHQCPRPIERFADTWPLAQIEQANLIDRIDNRRGQALVDVRDR